MKNWFAAGKIWMIAVLAQADIILSKTLGAELRILGGYVPARIWRKHV
jgi:hypothetical protein